MGGWVGGWVGRSMNEGTAGFTCLGCEPNELLGWGEEGCEPRIDSVWEGWVGGWVGGLGRGERSGSI